MGTVISTQKKEKQLLKGLDQADMPAEIEKVAQPEKVARSTPDLGEDTGSTKNLNAEDRLEKWTLETTENMEYLQSNDDYATEECFKIYDNLRKASTLKPRSKRALLGEHLISLGYIEIFPRMWNDLNSYQMYIDEPVPKAKQAHTNLKRMLGSYWNFTDSSDKVCIEFGKLKCLDLLIEGLKDPELSVDRLRDDGKRYVIKGILGIMHNCCRRISKNCKRCYTSIDQLQELTTSSFLIVRAKAFLVLAYVAKKTEVEMLTTNEACMKFLLKVMEEALTYKGHVTKKYGFSAVEILEGLNQLAINDGNKMLIVEHGGLPLIKRMLGEKCTDREKEQAASALWLLSFNDQSKEEIRQDPEIMKSLMSLKGHENPGIRDACMGALWEIYDSKVPFGMMHGSGEGGGHSEVSRSLSTLSIDSEAPHVMISYQWDTQERMVEIRDLLIKAGYNVWMDIDQMAGDILATMAQAVERSAVVLVCMTQKYSESQNCRTEATYAYKQKKPIVPLLLEEGYQAEGWLGALVGTLLYFKMFSDSEVSSNLPSMMKEMGDRGKMPIGRKNHVSVKHPSFEPQKSILTTTLSSPPISQAPALPAKTYKHNLSVNSSPISRWTSDQVRNWLESNNIQTLHATLLSLNGEQLIQMRKQLARAPEFFHRTLRDELQLGFLGILSLTAALDKLPI